MYMSRFAVKGYKCLEDVDIPLTPIHVLIGPNDSGKTAVLQAIAAYYSLRHQQTAAVFPKPWKGGDLVFGGSPNSRIEFRAEWAEPQGASQSEGSEKLMYEFTFQFPGTGADMGISRERMQRGDGPLIPVDRSRPGVVAPQGGVSWVGIENQINKVRKPARIFSLSANAMALPSKVDPARRFQIEHDGFGLPSLLWSIAGHDAELNLRLRSEFCRLFPHFKTFRVVPEMAYVRQELPDGRFLYAQQEGTALYFVLVNGTPVRAEHVSDGAILMLGFLALAHLPDPPSILLLEEPENGVYPKRLGEIIRVLKDMVSRSGEVRFPQIIMTTHSPYVLSFFEPEEVTFLSRPRERPEGGVRARPLRDAPNISERLGGGEFYLGELWYNLTEEELFGEPLQQRGD